MIVRWLHWCNYFCSIDVSVAYTSKWMRLRETRQLFLWLASNVKMQLLSLWGCLRLHIHETEGAWHFPRVDAIATFPIKIGLKAFQAENSVNSVTAWLAWTSLIGRLIADSVSGRDLAPEPINLNDQQLPPALTSRLVHCYCCWATWCMGRKSYTAVIKRKDSITVDRTHQKW